MVKPAFKLRSEKWFQSVLSEAAEMADWIGGIFFLSAVALHYSEREQRVKSITGETELHRGDAGQSRRLELRLVNRCAKRFDLVWSRPSVVAFLNLRFNRAKTHINSTLERPFKNVFPVRVLAVSARFAPKTLAAPSEDFRTRPNRHARTSVSAV